MLLIVVQQSWQVAVLACVVWLLTIESERCCDEETIASLPCKPAVYARSLLEVLELKHLLRIAPALTGMRPVDITVFRMERIMRIGHGSRRCSPWCVWCFAFVSGIAVLPGRPHLIAQVPEVIPTQSADKENALVDFNVAPEQHMPSVIGEAYLQTEPTRSPSPKHSTIPIDIAKKQQKAIDGEYFIHLEIQVMEVQNNSPEAKRLVEWMVKPAESDTQVVNYGIAHHLTDLISKVLGEQKPQANLTSHFRKEVLSADETEHFMDSLLKPCQPVYVSRPTLTTLSGVVATFTVGQGNFPNSELSEGFSIQAKPTVLADKRLLLGFVMSRKRLLKQFLVTSMSTRAKW